MEITPVAEGKHLLYNSTSDEPRVLGLKNWGSVHLHQHGRQKMGSRCSENIRMTEKIREGLIFRDVPVSSSIFLIRKGKTLGICLHLSSMAQPNPGYTQVIVRR